MIELINDRKNYSDHSRYPPSRGGAGIYCREVATAATKEGFNVNVWAPFKSEFDPEIIGSELSWKGSQSWISSIRLFFKIKKHLFQQDNHPIIHIGDLGVFVGHLPGLFYLFHPKPESWSPFMDQN